MEVWDDPGRIHCSISDMPESHFSGFDGFSWAEPHMTMPACHLGRLLVFKGPRGLATPRARTKLALLTLPTRPLWVGG